MVKVTALIGPKDCGKNILLKGLTMAAKELLGFSFVNLYDHVPPNEVYPRPANENKPNSIRNILIAGEFTMALKQAQIQHLVTVGFPETSGQIRYLLDEHPQARVILVDREHSHEERWIYHLAKRFADVRPDDFIHVLASDQFEIQARHIVSSIDLTDTERKYMLDQLSEETNGDALKFFKKANLERIDNESIVPPVPKQMVQQQAGNWLNPFLLARQQIEQQTAL